MKTQLVLASLALVLGFGAVQQANAAIKTSQNPPGAAGSNAWSSSASLCQITRGSANATIDYGTGGVSFAPGSSGLIGLFCPVEGIMNGITPSTVNQLAVTFSNPNVSAGCTVQAYFVDRTTGQHDGDTIPNSHDFNGSWTASVDLTSQTLPLNFSHTHEADVFLFRPASAGENCNPTVYGLFMQDFFVIH